MEQTNERRQALLHNLAQYAEPARAKLCLDLITAARLLGTDPSVIEAIEQGTGDDLSLEAAIGLAQGLGLTDLGLPRSKPSGSI